MSNLGDVRVYVSKKGKDRKSNTLVRKKTQKPLHASYEVQPPTGHLSVGDYYGKGGKKSYKTNRLRIIS